MGGRTQRNDPSSPQTKGKSSKALSGESLVLIDRGWEHCGCAEQEATKFTHSTMRKRLGDE
uniref:Uncharacterized protein n=1 Tax=Arundo donax TaxID=35708 RepID=A0A0A8Y6Q8_ARUDO